MLLYLIRHAEAEELGVGGTTRDFDRPLTARGREQSQALARAFVQRNITIDAVVASPLVRAHQTAAELIAVWMPGDRPTTCDELAIDKLKPGKLSEFLASTPARGARVPNRSEKAVAAVGHMPDLGAYLEWLIGAASETVSMAKASAACVRFAGNLDRGTGELKWLITPDWFMLSSFAD